VHNAFVLTLRCQDHIINTKCDMKNESLVYRKCANCGIYISPDSPVSDNFCSNDCRVQYERCSNCGKYFQSGTGHSPTICSPDCSITYLMTKQYDEEKYIHYEKESA
jgi:hypothetical protein